MKIKWKWFIMKRTSVSRWQYESESDDGVAFYVSASLLEIKHGLWIKEREKRKLHTSRTLSWMHIRCDPTKIFFMMICISCDTHWR